MSCVELILACSLRLGKRTSQTTLGLEHAQLFLRAFSYGYALFSFGPSRSALLVRPSSFGPHLGQLSANGFLGPCEGSLGEVDVA
jgi:hypothetical protein